MKNETTLKPKKESSSNKEELMKFGGSSSFKNDSSSKNKESILFRNIDIKMDIFNTHLERDIQRLPENLRFIKKYLYLDFLPKIDKLIDELEKIKKTSNYDEKVIQIKPLQITKTPAVSCCDLFDNHNIKHMRSNKIIYGTLNGNIVIFDFEVSKILNEKLLGNKSRVEIIATSTIKVYDSLISRIAVNFRGDPTITVLCYNHTYNSFNTECVVNLKDNYANFTMDPNSIGLNTLPCNIKFSKDTYFMTVFDYIGGIRVYKFNEIPQSPAILDSRPPKKDSALGFSFLMPKNNNLEKKLNALDAGAGNGPSASQNANFNAQNNSHLNPNAISSSNNIAISATCIGYFKNKETENYTILALNAKNSTTNADASDKNKTGKNPPAAAAGKKEDPKGKKSNTDKGGIISEAPADEPCCYAAKELFDNNNFDLTPFIKFSKNNPDVVFVQKKLILDEKVNGGFSTCTVTVGIYICFYGSTLFKYISLYPYLTDNMKNVFKVTKSKGSGMISQEESMSIASSMAKKEKEYINFLKTKLEPMVNSVNNAHNSTQNLHNLNNNSGQIVPNNPSAVKDAKPSASTANPGAGTASIQNPNFTENTKSEFNFNTLVNITHMCGQNQISQKTSLIAIGMVDGSVLIWDTELHCDKYLFQDNKNEILSMTMNSNFLTTSAKDGQVFIFDLVKGSRVFNCYHNPYKNFPVFYTGSFFSYMNLAIDTENKICVYNSKEAHKIAKLVLENSSKKYKVAYFNKHLLSCTQEFLVMICEKDLERKERLNLIDLIKFQNQPLKPLLKEYSENNLEFINYFQNLYSQEIKNKRKNYIVTFRIKEVLLKCYPQLIMANKKGLSLNKIMAKYTMNNIPSFETKENFNYFYGNLKKNSLQDADHFNNNNRKNKKLFPTLKSVKENELDSIEDVDKKRLGTDQDSIDKDSLTMKNSAMNDNNTQPSLKSLMTPESPASKLKSGQMLNLDDLQNMNDNNINIVDYSEAVKHGKEEEMISSQKKNIFYLAFKNIKNRYQFREQRSNKIKLRSEEILKEFRFPSGASPPKPKKDQFFSMKLETIRNNGTNKPFLNTKFS